MHKWHAVLTTLISIFAISFILFMWKQNSAPIDLASVTPLTAPESMPENTGAATDSIMIALLDTKQISNGPSRGCDKIVMQNEIISSTTDPLRAALNTLFELGTTSVSGWFNFIPRTAATLRLANTTVIDGAANIYLTGTLSGLAGVCDDPRTDIQIEETAKQFPTVQTVHLYLNNQLVPTLAPSM